MGNNEPTISHNRKPVCFFFCLLSPMTTHGQTFEERFDAGQDHILHYRIIKGIEVLGNLYSDLKSRPDVPNNFKNTVTLAYAQILELGDQDERALELLTKLEQTQSELKKNQETVLLHITLARMNEKLGYSSEAYYNLQNAYQAILTTGNDSLRARYYKRMASLIRVNGAEDSLAICYLDSATIFANKYEDANEMGDINMVKGLIAATQGKYTKAELHLNEAFGNWANLEDENGKITLLMILAQIRMKQEEPKQVLELIDSVMVNYHPQKYPGWNEQIYRMSVWSYEALESKDSVIVSLHKLTEEIQQNEANKNTIAIAELKVRYREDEIENELEKAEQNIRFQSALNLRLFIILFISCLASIVLFVFLRIARRNKRYIERQRKELQQALEDNEVLFEEVHHRVKNNISIISSMMQIQAREVDDKALKEKLKENELRIRSIGLVHTLIFNYDRIQRLLIDQYFNELVKGIIETYGDDLNANVTINSDRINAGLNIMVPIGLLMNELVTNSVKHAKVEKLNIEILTTYSKETLQITYRDNGKGFNSDALIGTNSFGISMIKRMTRQIEGKLIFSPPGSHEITLEIPFVNSQ